MKPKSGYTLETLQASPKYWHHSTTHAASRSSTPHALLRHGIPRSVVMLSVFSFATRYVVKGAAQTRDKSTRTGVVWQHGMTGA